jgi:hypothetical protein
VAEYLSYAEQSYHYFSRLHDGPATSPVESPAAWRGADLAGSQTWRHALRAEQVEELERALVHAAATGRAIGDLTVDDFPLPTLGPVIRTWRDEIANGRGFQVVSGVPVERWSATDAERFFWCLGLHMGRPGAQNPKGDLLGHVTDTGADAEDPYVRLYQTSSDIAFDCDAADVVGLLCLSPGMGPDLLALLLDIAWSYRTSNAKWGLKLLSAADAYGLPHVGDRVILRLSFVRRPNRIP